MVILKAIPSEHLKRIAWLLGTVECQIMADDLGGRFNRVKSMIYCSLVDSRLAPDEKAEYVNQLT